ncbi:MAG: amino acid adenylation protein [Verrucomicrobiales bacterium]|nr:amino acid adenylation protein [Verrucomicrobiales bacterium]
MSHFPDPNHELEPTDPAGLPASLEGIAIVGMAGRFPGAETLTAFWENLTAGRETISTIPLEEIPAEENKLDPDYVPRRGVLEKPEWFDAAFFNINPREAEVIDPQQRLFLESCWHALEDAGCDPARYPGAIGVYAGMSNSSWVQHQILPNAELRAQFGYEGTMIANEKDYLATRTAYKLNLRGPAINIYTACSTSLVSVCQAVQALQSFACDAALAGGVSVKWPQHRGYTAQEGSLYSPDGHCRPYDADSRGTVFSNGLGVVLLKRLDDAVRDGDHIWAVIKGAALNNDGGEKASFTAPSVDGHAEVIALAQALANVDPDTISYVEGHGTATPIGDPIEVAGLTQAFRLGTERKNFCGLGSLKSNTGHMDAAAGIGGLIKTTLSLHHRQLPPTLHFQRPNPALNLGDSPFYVVDKLRPWTSDHPLRAGVSSFGVGGTNAHVVLEEAPYCPPSDGPSRPHQLLVLSAKTPDALTESCANLADHLGNLSNLKAEKTEDPHALLADTAWTLQTGRQSFAHRRAVAVCSLVDAIAQLRTPGPLTHTESVRPPIVFLFPGQGSQHPGMGLELHAHEPAYREAFDACAVEFDKAGIDLPALFSLATPVRGSNHPGPTSQDPVARPVPALSSAPENAPAASLYPPRQSDPLNAAGQCSENKAGTGLATGSGIATDTGIAVESGRPDLNDTRYTQPALFAMEYAFAKLLLSFGITPSAMLGHSIGEYVAATLAGVMSLEDAAKLVSLRGQLMAAMAPGSMLAVRLAEAEVKPLLPAGLDIAALNAPGLTVVSGPTEAIEAFTLTLESGSHSARKLHTSHAFHSSMMEPALEDFRAAFANITLHAPQLPYISNLTGHYITEAEATDPDYYVRHIRHAVRFADGIATLCQAGPSVFLEVGPGTALAPLAKQHPAAAGTTSLSLLPPAKDAGANELQTFLQSLGKAWCAGLTLDWAAFHHHTRRLRLSLPGYAFQRQRYCPDTILPPGTIREGEAWIQLPTNDQGRDQNDQGREHGREHGPLARESQANNQSPASSPAALSSAGIETETPGPEARAPFSRREYLITELQTQLHQISGIDTTAADPATSFLDLGFDSLFLTSASNSLKKHFGLKITFRQLMEDQACITDLATWLDSELPPDKFQPLTVARPVPALSGAPVLTHAANHSIASTAPGVFPAQGRDGLASGSTADRLAIIEQQISALRSTLTQSAPSASNTAASAYSVPVKTLKGTDGKKIAFGPFKPIERTKDGSLTETQQAHLAELIAGYTGKYPKAKAFTADHREVFADPRAVAGFNLLWKDMVFPAVTDRSEGAYLWDTDGNRWIDVVHGFGLGFFGHRPKFVTDALHEQIDKGFEIGPTSPLAGEVAHLIREFSGQERVAFCNTGSEALMAAIRTSRTISGRNIIAMFAGGYHGIFDEVLARPLVINGELRSIPIAPGIPDLAQASILVLEYDNPESLEILHRFGQDIACVLVEPVMSRRPDVVPIDFVRKLRAITRETGTALVFDEVVLGFRTGPGGAQQFFGIEADLVTYGKVIGGGMPLGVICGQRKYMDALDGGAWQYGDDSMPEVGVTFFAGTFIRHPLTLAAARAVLLRLKEIGPTLQQAVEAKTKDFVDRLNALFESTGVPVKSTRFSSMWMLNADPGLKYFGLLYYHLRLRGIHLWEGRPGFLSTTHTAQDIEEILTAFSESIAALQAGGFFPAVSSAEPGASAGDGEFAALEAPTTPAQQEMFIASQLSADAALACHESLSLCLTGPLDTEILTKALTTLVQRHDSLRATFSADGQLMRFNPDASVNFRETSLGAHVAVGSGAAENVGTAAESEERLDAIRAEEFLTPFDLEAGPLHRFLLVRTGPETAELIFTAHHIVCDGWSFGVLVHEFPAALESATTGAGGAFLTPSPSYADYALQQHSARRSGAFAEDRSYWNQQFRSLPTPLVLPTDGPANASPGYTAGAASAHLPADLAGRLKAFCRARKITPYHALLSVYQILLHRLSGQTDFLIGMPVAGQPNAGMTGLTGHCVQFLPLRSALDPADTALSLTQKTRSLTLSAQEHQNITLGEILDFLPSLSGQDRQRFVAATFSLEPAPEVITAGPLTGTPVGNPKRRLSFDLSLYVFQSTDGLQLRCAYRSDLFSRQTITRWLSHFITLTESLVTGPEQEIRRLPMLDEAQRHSLIHGFNDRQLDFPDAPCLHHWFEKQARHHAGRTAVNGGGISMSYQELNSRANRIAHLLIGKSIGPGSLVGLCMDRSPDLIAALLGILKAGAAYLPIDLSYPADRLAFMLEDAGARVLLTQHHLAKELPSHQGETLYLDDAADLLNAQPDTDPVTSVTPADTAYVIYTSGSTGKPKGCMVTHHNVSRLMLATEPWFGFSQEDVWTLFHSTAFDFSVWEIWGALLYGGRLLTVPFLTTRSPDEFYQLLSAEGVTVLNQTPSAFRQLIHAEQSAPRPLPLSLRYIIFGGEALDMASLTPWFDLHGDSSPQLVNMYGITETTVHVTYRPLRRSDAAGGSVIGVPIPDLQLYILHPETLEPQPIGVPGEMFVGGAGLATGYLNRPELTGERFPVNHLTNIGRLYRTGDLARFIPAAKSVAVARPGPALSGAPENVTAGEDPSYQSDISPAAFGRCFEDKAGTGLATGGVDRCFGDKAGTGLSTVSADGCYGDMAGTGSVLLDIVYLGRIDHQVKMRGVRIELGEIESTLTHHAQIRQAAVLARTDRQGDKKLFAYLIPSDKSAPPTTADLRAHLLKTLPDYMVPTAFLYLDRFPLTTNGKLDHTALPTPDPTAIVTPEDFTPPQTETQRHIAGLWQEIIGSNHIGVGSDFFASGGTSLNALRLMQKIRQDFSVTLPLGVLFKSPTLGLLSEAIDTARTSPLLRTAGSALTCLQEGLGGTPLFLIHGGDGGAIFYRSLLPKLGPDASVYIIESPALTDDAWLLARKNVEATAHHFITLMQTVQPDGPYRIGGYSFGGLVAYEMAQQLRATGESTERLIMFDTENPGVGVRMLSLTERLAAGWRQGGQDFSSKIKGLSDRIGSGIRGKMNRDSVSSHVRSLLDAGTAVTGSLRINQVRETHVDAMHEYKVRPYAGPLVLLRSTAENDKYERLPDYGWGPMVSSVEIRDVPGNHLELFDPENADVLATQLREALEGKPGARFYKST